MIRAVLLSCLLLPLAVQAAEPLTPDQLLQRVRSERAAEEQAMADREKTFVAESSQRTQLLSKAKAALAEQKAEAERLKAEFDRQENELAEQEKLLAQRSGTLGEVFGVIRQSAGDVANQWQDNLLNAQYPKRLAALRKLSESRTLPSADDLENYWMLLLEDLTASGRVERVDLPVVAADGSRETRPVLRVGNFSAYTNDAMLRYDADSHELLAPPKQPSGLGQLDDYLSSNAAVAPLPITTTRLPV